MNVTMELLNVAAGNQRYVKRKQGFANSVNEAKAFAKYKTPLSLCCFLSQVMIECGYFRYTEEVWGPTRAQKGYEGRQDLGNIQAGDGKRYKGHGGIQVTGRSNHRDLTTWARSFYPDAPDFEKNPELLATEEWFALGAIWYWVSRVPVKYINAGNLEMITRRVNGGLNHYAERLVVFDRVALYMLGYSNTKDSLIAYQKAKRLEPDGIIGPATRSALVSDLQRAGVVEPPKKNKDFLKHPPDVKFPTKTPVKKKPSLIEMILAILRGKDR